MQRTFNFLVGLLLCLVIGGKIDWVGAQDGSGAAELKMLQERFAAELSTLNKPLELLQEKYRGYLTKQKAAYQAGGQGQAMLAVDDELKKFDGETDEPLSNYPELKRLQEIYRTQRAPIQKSQLSLIQTFQKSATDLAAKLTTRGQTDEANLALAEAKRLGSMTGRFSTVANLSAIPQGMRSRCSKAERMKFLREGGGEERAEQAVENGLNFLTSQQDKETGAFGKEYKVGMTGLALLAYSGHCETIESPTHGDAVIKAALYLMDRGIKNEGYLVTVDGTGGHASAYEHAIGTYALAEFYTMTKATGKEIPRLEPILKKAVDRIVDAQDPMGGWSYGFTAGQGNEDLSVSSWMIQALNASHYAGKNFVKVDKCLDKAIAKFLPAMQDEDGLFKYGPDNPTGKTSLTAAALFGMQMWDQMGNPSYDKGFAALKKAFPNPAPGNNYYTPYYNTNAFFMHGGKEWVDFNNKFQPKLLDAQASNGSWTTGNSVHGMEDSQIMNTAWAIMMLEVYYRNLPITQ